MSAPETEGVDMHIVVCFPAIDVEVNLGELPYWVQTRAINSTWGDIGFS